ncbi:MAG TPA: hypothetical protein VKG80_12000 [Trebonia sp.]|nr:hypothetical protein [Trebonia sp.]
MTMFSIRAEKSFRDNGFDAAFPRKREIIRRRPPSPAAAAKIDRTRLNLASFLDKVLAS